MPVVIHGDLWSGNKGKGVIGGEGAVEEVVFDPSAVWGHSEYELGIMNMFVSCSFFNFLFHTPLSKVTLMELSYQLGCWRLKSTNCTEAALSWGVVGRNSISALRTISSFANWYHDCSM